MFSEVPAIACLSAPPGESLMRRPIDSLISSGRVSQFMQRIEADRLIIGDSDVIRSGCVIIDGGTISFAGPLEDAPISSGSAISVPVAMPGLWDSHAHFMGIRTADYDEGRKTSPIVLAARCTKDSERALAAGFTSVREAGGYGLHMAEVVDEGSVAGPHIYAAGSILGWDGPTDISECPDGVQEIVKAVRTQLRRGAKLIKVIATGAALSESGVPGEQQFSEYELKVMVDEAARAGRIVAAHCHGKSGIVASLKAGCRTIEHGSYLDEEAADLMLEKDAILVPTRFIVERLTKLARHSGLPDNQLEKTVALADSHRRAMQLAVRKGVKIALGSDIFTSGEGTPVPWGMNATELEYLVEAGMTPLQSIQAATSMGPLTLGPGAPKAGLLKAGYDADVIALEASPLQDVSVLADPKNVTYVWKAGKLTKQPLIG